MIRLTISGFNLFKVWEVFLLKIPVCRKLVYVLVPFSHHQIENYSLGQKDSPSSIINSCICIESTMHLHNFKHFHSYLNAVTHTRPLHSCVEVNRWMFNWQLSLDDSGTGTHVWYEHWQRLCLVPPSHLPVRPFCSFLLPSMNPHGQLWTLFRVIQWTFYSHGYVWNVTFNKSRLAKYNTGASGLFIQRKLSCTFQPVWVYLVILLLKLVRIFRERN